MANRPLIGLTTYRESIRWGKWHMPALFTPETYVSAVDRAGGEPLLLPTALGHARSAVLALVDGLLVVGGADIARKITASARSRKRILGRCATVVSWKRSTMRWATICRCSGSAEACN